MVRFLRIQLLVWLLLSSVVGCIASSQNTEENGLLALLAMLGIRGPGGGSAPAPIVACEAPEITIPPSLPTSMFEVKKSDVDVPRLINGMAVPVGAVFEIGMVPEAMPDAVIDHIQFKDEPATITYKCNLAQVSEAGLIEEFGVYYMDKKTKQWRQADVVLTDPDSGTVTAKVSHFTPYVLTAFPAARGTVANPPACIDADYPNGLSGSANAQFTTIDRNFRYYQDRDYYIVPDADFDALGFSQALGIATCNGGSACGPFSAHKHYQGSNYISFTAHTDIDLYVMYDTRGGGSRTDDSSDAAWIAAAGFQNTGRFIQTTDSVGYYKVYSKTYLRGESVTLHGNRQNAGGGVNTNYWIVMKRRGITNPEPGATLCEAAPDPNPPARVTNLRAIPGANQVILLWDNPNDPDFNGTVIRRSITAAPAFISDGVAPGGTVVNPHAYRDEGLSISTRYHYTVFALDKNVNFQSGVSVTVTTGPDSDADGIADSYEISTYYPTGRTSRFNQTDTDGDGIPDGAEVENGTDPTNGDNARPVISQFLLVGPAETTNPTIAFHLNGTDNIGITGWMVTETPDPPDPGSVYWQILKPNDYRLVKRGTYTLYAWAKDDAGNVSTAVPPLAIELLGISVPKFVYATSSDAKAIAVMAVDANTGRLTQVGETPTDHRPMSIVIDPTGLYAFVGMDDLIVNEPTRAVSYRIDQNSGALTLIDSHEAGLLSGATMDLAVHPSGNTLYFPGGNNTNVLPYSVARDSGMLGPMSGLPTDGAPLDITVHPNGRFFYATKLNGVNQDLTPGLVSGLIDLNNGLLSAVASEPAGICPRITIHPNGQHAYAISYTLGKFIYHYTIDPVDGHLTLRDSTTVAPNSAPWNIEFHPSGRFAYVVDQNEPTIEIFSVDPQTGELTSAKSVNALRALTFRFSADGRFAYAANWRSSSISVFEVNAATGDINHLQTLDLTAQLRGPSDVAILSTIDGNDPPVANPGRERNVKTGEATALSGHLSFDPDAARCQAEPTNYSYQWSILSAPAGSAATATNSQSLNSASFTPDIAGDYVIELAFRDSPGECNGSAKTSRATVTFHASANPPAEPPPLRYPEPPPPPPPAIVIKHRIGSECWIPTTANGDPPAFGYPGKTTFQGFPFCDATIESTEYLDGTPFALGTLVKPRPDAHFTVTHSSPAEWGYLALHYVVPAFPFPWFFPQCRTAGPYVFASEYCSEQVPLPALWIWWPVYPTETKRIQWYWTEIVQP